MVVALETGQESADEERRWAAGGSDEVPALSAEYPTFDNAAEGTQWGSSGRHGRRWDKVRGPGWTVAQRSQQDEVTVTTPSPFSFPPWSDASG